MRFTVLGSGAAFPAPGHPCSGFLVQTPDATLWLDAGNGTFANLQTHVAYSDVEALIITHAHADHMSDAIPFMYALGMGEIELPPVPVHAPPDVPQRLRGLLGETSTEMFDRVFDFNDLGPEFELGSLGICPFRTVHPAETYGIRLKHHGRSIVYSSDTAYSDELVASFSGADVLVSEATYVGDYDHEEGVHLWARQTGELAKAAGVAKLVVSHVWGMFEVDDAVAEAAEAFGGPTEACVAGAVYEL